MGTSPWDIANIMQGQQFGPDDLLMPQGAPARDPAAVPVSPKFRPAPLAMQPNFMPGAQRSPASLGHSPVSREALQQAMEQQQSGVQSLADYAQRYKDLMAKRGGDLSPLLRLIDTAAGSSTAEGYVSPQDKEAAKITKEAAMQKMVNDARTPIATELLKQYNNENSAESKFYRGLDSKNQASEKFLNKLQTDMGTDFDTFKASSRTPMGQLATKIVNSNAILALVARHPDLNLDKRQMFDFAGGLAKMVTGNNGVISDNQLNHLIPSTMQGKFADWKEFLVANPQGKEQQEFVRRMTDDVLAEEQNVRQQIEGAMESKKAKYQQLAIARPDIHDAIVNGATIKRPKAIEEFLKTYKPQSADQSGVIEVRNDAGVPKWVAPADLEKAKANGFNPVR